MFPRKAAAPRSPRVKRVIFYKYRQNLWKSRAKQPGRNPTRRSGCFCNNKIVKKGLFSSIYPIWPTKVQHKLHGHVVNFRDFILVLNSERLSEFLMSIGTFTLLQIMLFKFKVFIDCNSKKLLLPFSPKSYFLQY